MKRKMIKSNRIFYADDIIYFFKAHVVYFCNLLSEYSFSTKVHINITFDKTNTNRRNLQERNIKRVFIYE